MKHALGFFERDTPCKGLYFCIGERDHDDGDVRFEKIAALSARTGIEAEIIAAPTGAIAIRATDLRAQLANGAHGHDPFAAAMPTHLSSAQRDAIWSYCRSHMQDAREVAQRKVGSLLRSAGLPLRDIAVARAGKRDEVFRVRLRDGGVCFVKYAKDTVSAARFSDPPAAKPRSRLSVERRALRWLKDNNLGDIEVPRVVHHDSVEKLLVLSEVCPRGHALDDHFARGIYDTTVARRLGWCLAHWHWHSGVIAPLWRGDDGDTRHWRHMLANLASVSCRAALPSSALSDLEALRTISDQARRCGFMHLDFRPSNIRLEQDRLGIIDFERSANTGDPAFDLGVLVGDYIAAGIETSSGAACRDAIAAMLESYAATAGKPMERLGARVVSFAGAGLLRARQGARSGAAARERGLRLLRTGLELNGSNDCPRVGAFSQGVLLAFGQSCAASG